MSEVIGMDLGGTKVALARLEGNDLGESIVEPTEDSSSETVVEQLARMIESARGEDLRGVGIGVPSVVEFGAGRVVSSTNLPLADVALRDVLGERIGVPVFVDNDANVAALAEAHDDELRMVARDVVMLTVGTGVGGGLILGGRIYRGATGGAGELGHTLIGMPLDGDVIEPGDFPQMGSLEYAAAGHALDRLAAELARESPESALGRRLADGEKVDGEQAVEAARAGDQTASRTVEMWGERLGIGIANVINTFDPEEVVIGGGAARAGDLLLGPARRIAADFVLPGLGSRTLIRIARHGVRAGVLGAALLAVHELSDDPGPVATHDLAGSSEGGS
ncbi:MAG: ROK family protein [Actinomycetota bacterium]|nr:ROK family protein [Actinomycetota bacterium]